MMNTRYKMQINPGKIHGPVNPAPLPELSTVKVVNGRTLPRVQPGGIFDDAYRLMAAFIARNPAERPPVEHMERTHDNTRLTLTLPGATTLLAVWVGDVIHFDGGFHWHAVLDVNDHIIAEKLRQRFNHQLVEHYRLYGTPKYDSWVASKLDESVVAELELVHALRPDGGL